MLGENDTELGRFNETISELCANGGLRLKAIVRSGSTDEEGIKKLSRSVLGML